MTRFQPPPTASANDRFFALRLGGESVELRALTLAEVESLGVEWEEPVRLGFEYFGVLGRDGSPEQDKALLTIVHAVGPELLVEAIPRFAPVNRAQLRALSRPMRIMMALAIARLTTAEFGVDCVMATFNEGLAKAAQQCSAAG